jgi:putative membrane protein
VDKTVAVESRGVVARMRAALAAMTVGHAPAPTPVVPAVDRGTELAQVRTDLALDRSFLAAERTLMAWMRTSLSMISFGFTIVKFLQYAAEERNLSSFVGPFGHKFGPNALGLTLVTIGTLSLAFAVIQHRQTLQRLHQRGLAPRWSLTLTVAGLISLLGVFAAGSLILKY